VKRATTLFVFAVGSVGSDRRATHAPPTAVASTPATQATRPPTSIPATPMARPSPSARAGLDMSFDVDTVGGPASGIQAVIGDWVVAEREGARGLLVDGSRWRNGSPSVNLADQARRLYGDRYAEFLDGVRAYAFFPLAVAEQDPPDGDVRMSVRFYPFAGQIDQAAGIAFGIQPDGSYFCVRANALEDNILWARVVRGRRTIIDNVRNTPTPSRVWHTLATSIRGLEMNVELDGVHRLRKTLEAVPHGRVGLWSKADSQVLFDDFRVQSLR
jgi:hypothetical protein